MDSDNQIESIAQPQRTPPTPQMISSEQTGRPFKYDCLAGLYYIRLVVLEPSRNTDSPIRCRLVQANLSQKPQYEALSYVWGDLSNKVLISLEDADFSITINLWSALSRLRLEHESRVLWVDAICIYSYRTATKHLGNLRFMPQFSEGCDFFVSEPENSYSVLSR
jgi:Heterokaryon incompatibility protein (HET)